MKKLIVVVAAILALLVPQRADAMPKYWQDSAGFTRAGIIYRVKDGTAVVTRIRRNICIAA